VQKLVLLPRQSRQKKNSKVNWLIFVSFYSVYKR
jgi:hypothetical protein